MTTGVAVVASSTTTTSDAEEVSSLYSIGDCVSTVYGAGVIVDQNDPQYTVLLWRHASVASTATAMVQPSAILQRLPVAPGMRVVVERRQGDAKRLQEKSWWFVETYHASTHECTIREEDAAADTTKPLRRVPVAFFDNDDDDNATIVTTPAPLYPLLWALLEHADRATAALRSSQPLIEHAERTVHATVQELATTVASHSSVVETDARSSAAAPAPPPLPVRAVLEQCQARWEQLAAPVSAVATQKLAEAGIQLERSSDSSTTTTTALEALQTLLTPGTDATAKAAWSTIHAAAASDPIVAGWLDASSTVSDTRAAQIWQESASQWHARATEWWGSEDLLTHVTATTTTAVDQWTVPPVVEQLLLHALPRHLLEHCQNATTSSSSSTSLSAASVIPTLLASEWRDQAVGHMEHVLFTASVQWRWPPALVLSWAAAVQGKADPSSSNALLLDVLNNDAVVAASERLAQSGEYVMDMVTATAGDKDSMVRHLMGDSGGGIPDEFQRVMATADWHQAMEDATQRQKVLAQATDAALDFCLRILPSMPVPPFDGVRDGLVYHIGNLSMEGFRVRKETIQIQLAGMTAASTETTASEGRESTTTTGAATAAAIANELLVIDIHDISAVLEDATWSFEQTYLPYLKGSGKASVQLAGGSIRLQFALRKRRNPATQAWEPVLCLHDRQCAIEDVALTLDGTGRLTWAVNKLAAIFKGPLRDYVVGTILKVLSHKSGWILQRLNDMLGPYGDVILRTAKLDLDDLMEAEEDAIVAEPEEETGSAVIELVWRERLPLGMNLLLNDDSGQLKVVDFPRGSQARAVCENRGLSADAFEGASIVTVNGTRYEHDAEEELFEALKDPARPKSVGFILAESEEAERVRQFLAEGEDTKKDPADEIKPRLFALRHALFEDPGELGIEFGNSPDGTSLVVKGFLMDESGIVLAAERCNNIRIGDLLTHVNDEAVLAVDGAPCHTKSIELLQAACNVRPLKLSFCEPYLHEVSIQNGGSQSVNSTRSGGPDELMLKQLTTNAVKRRIYICGFNSTSGAVESAGILLGDHLVFLNGEPVGVGCRWMSAPRIPSLTETLSILQSPKSYPIALTFARPKQTAAPRSPRWGDDVAAVFQDSDADTICVTAECYDQLGITLDSSSSGGNGSVVVGSFLSVPGPFQRSLPFTADHEHYRLALESIDKRVLPSYATVQLVKNALTRSWKTDLPTQLLLCDDALKEWLNGVVRDADDERARASENDQP